MGVIVVREWINLTKAQREAERDKVPGSYERKARMDKCLAATLELLKDDQFAQAKAWKITWGNYLINTTEEIAAHCRATAHGKAVG